MTIDESIAALRAADPEERFSFSIDTSEWFSPLNGYETRVSFSIIATGDEQHAAHNRLTLDGATREICEAIRRPALSPAQKLRAEAAKLLDKAAQLEAQG